MSKPGTGQHFDVEDTFGNLIDNAAKIAFWGGLLAFLVGCGCLVYQVSVFSADPPANVLDQARSNVAILQKVMMVGLIVYLVGSTFMFWGEEAVGVAQLFFAGAMYFSPLYLPPAFGMPSVSSVTGAALEALQLGGLMLGAGSILVLLIELVGRVRVRAQQGARSEFLKYGKGVKEEKDVRNVFMGKCWQLPFCRKFVRERCPIYHAKRTCWKELVGCMCEEEVIRNAMENRPIPKDLVAASKYIPVNNKITNSQKRERCRMCVIFNEHQKHKYRLYLPVTIGIWVLFYVAFRTPMLTGMNRLIGSLDSVVSRVTYQENAQLTKAIGGMGLPFEEILLICFIVVLLAYSLKMLEFVIFKAKL